MINVQRAAGFCTDPGTNWLMPQGPSVQDCGVTSYGLEDRLVGFGTIACQLADRLPRTPLGQHAALQLARSSTSTFANYGEVQGAESRRDFIHKLGICLKELRETRTWL